MVVPPSVAWKLVLALTLAVAILLSQFARAPRASVGGVELRRLVVAALGLYGVGALASLTHHPLLAALVYAAGIATCALAAWLSRGTDTEGPPGADEPVDEHPPPQPDGAPDIDWARFEADFRTFCQRGDDRAGISR
jgi:hypothetical protein